MEYRQQFRLGSIQAQSRAFDITVLVIINLTLHILPLISMVRKIKQKYFLQDYCTPQDEIMCALIRLILPNSCHLKSNYCHPLFYWDLNWNYFSDVFRLLQFLLTGCLKTSSISSFQESSEEIYPSYCQFPPVVKKPISFWIDSQLFTINKCFSVTTFNNCRICI